MLTLSDQCNCCGVSFLQNWPNTTNHTSAQLDDLRHKVSAIISGGLPISGVADHSEDFNSSFDGEGSALIVTLSEYQYSPALNKMLKGLGFTSIPPFVNANSGNKVYIFVYTPPMN